MESRGAFVSGVVWAGIPVELFTPEDTDLTDQGESAYWDQGDPRGPTGMGWPG